MCFLNCIYSAWGWFLVFYRWHRSPVLSNLRLSQELGHVASHFTTISFLTLFVAWILWWIIHDSEIGELLIGLFQLVFSVKFVEVIWLFYGTSQFDDVLSGSVSLKLQLDWGDVFRFLGKHSLQIDKVIVKVFLWPFYLAHISRLHILELVGLDVAFNPAFQVTGIWISACPAARVGVFFRNYRWANFRM